MASPLDIEMDWRAFGRRVLRPAWNRVDAVQSVASSLLPRECERPRADDDRAGMLEEVWEGLTTRFGRESLHDDPRRMFLPFLELLEIEYRPGRPPQASDTPRRFLTHAPADIETMVGLIATEPAVLATVEAAAFEACARLRPWDVPTPTAVAWTLLHPKHPLVGYPKDIFGWPAIAAAWALRSSTLPDQAASLDRAAEDALRDVEEGMKDTSKGILRSCIGLTYRLIRDVRAWVAWRSLTRTEDRIAPSQAVGPGYPHAMVGARFSDLPDVFDALLTPAGLGYMVLDIRGDVVVLGLPATFLSANSKKLRWLSRTAIERYHSARIRGEGP